MNGVFICNVSLKARCLSFGAKLTCVHGHLLTSFFSVLFFVLYNGYVVGWDDAVHLRIFECETLDRGKRRIF